METTSEQSSDPAAVTRTTAPGHYVLVYDGLCRFCTAMVKKFAGLMGGVSPELVDFQQPGALERFPGLTHEACLRAMQMVTPEGRVYSGMEAVARALATRRVIGPVALMYYVPGLRWLLDRAYGLVAANRYRIMGKAVAAGECEGGTCSLHLAHHQHKN